MSYINEALRAPVDAALSDGHNMTAIPARALPLLAPLTSMASPDGEPEATDALLIVVGNELRSPIAPLKIRLQQTRARLRRDLANAPDTEHARDHQHDIENLSKALYQVERLQHQAALLLDALALMRGDLDLAPRCLDLREIAQRLVEIYANADPHRAMYLEDFGGSLTGDWDGGRIEIAIREMLGAALRYANGDILVRLERNSSYARLTVEDVGAKIPQDVRERLFEPFVTGAQPNDGLGLGLYVAREIAHLHGGEMGTERTETGGTAVWLTLPLDTVEGLLNE